jgi:membrane fusion protein, heavy metal efflux system
MLTYAFTMIGVSAQDGSEQPYAGEHDSHEGHNHDDHVDEDNCDHDDHSGHGHEDHGDEGIRLTETQRVLFNIEVRQAGPGVLSHALNLSGEIVANGDRLVHLSPRVSGIVKNVSKTLGDHVESGEVIAVLESRELADYKAEYIASGARKTLAEQNYRREQQLFKKKITSEQEFLDAKTVFVEASIEKKSAQQKLRALGFSEEYLKTLSDQEDADITRYEVMAPIEGTIISKHISLGENIDQSTEIFVVADLSTVWVNLTVHAKDLQSIQQGQSVLIQSEFNGDPVEGKIEMLTPFVDEITRTALARVVIDNTDGKWFPGTFVNSTISESGEASSLVVPKDAVVTIDEKSIVFVENRGVFEMRQVKMGRADRTHVEILSGLTRGASYVAEGAFQLKSTIVTSNLDSHAGHGH